MGKGRAPCCDKSKVKKGPWSPIEDLRLTTFIQNHGHDNWRALPKRAGLLRCGKSCRLRWINYLRPDVKRGNFTPEEELTIINLHNSIGNKWSKIASYLPGRTDNEIKNVWNTHLKKRLISKNSSADDCHKSTKTNHSESASCTSSSSITSAGKQNVKKSLVDPGVAQESEMIKKRNKKTEFLIVKSTHPRDEEKSSSFDSPTSSYASNLDNRCNEALDFSKTEVMNPDDGKIEIPLESDIDFWELFDSVDQFHSAKTEDQNEQGSNHHAEKLGSGIECTKWLRFLETELGLTSDVDHLPKDQNIAPTSPQYRELNFEPEIGPGLDFFPIWPTSPQNLGI